MKKLKTSPIVIILFSVFLDLLGFSIVIPILAPLLVLPDNSYLMPGVGYEVRVVVYGFLIASYAFAQFLASPLIGELSDRYGRKPLLAISFVGTFISRILFIIGILNINVPLLFISRIIDGITGGNLSVAQSAIADISKKEDKAKNFGIMGAAFGIGFVMGPYIAGRLADANLVSSLSSFLPLWIADTKVLGLWFATLLCGLNVLFITTSFPETIKQKIHKKLKPASAITNIFKAFKLKNLRVVFFTVFLFTLGFSFVTQFLSVYIGTRFKDQIREYVVTEVDSGRLNIKIPDQLEAQFSTMSDTVAADLARREFKILAGYESEVQKRSADTFSYIGIWVAIAQGFLARILAKRFKPAQLLRFGLFGLSFATLLFVLPGSFLSAHIEWLFLILPLLAITNGLTQPNSTAIVSNSADEKSQGEVIGINQSVSSLAQALPPIIYVLLITRFSEKELEILPIVLGSIFVFLGFLVFVFFYRNRSNQIFREE